MTVDRVDSVEWSVLGWVSAGVGRCWDASVLCRGFSRAPLASGSKASG